MYDRVLREANALHSHLNGKENKDTQNEEKEQLEKVISLWKDTIEMKNDASLDLIQSEDEYEIKEKKNSCVAIEHNKQQKIQNIYKEICNQLQEYVQKADEEIKQIEISEEELRAKKQVEFENHCKQIEK